MEVASCGRLVLPSTPEEPERKRAKTESSCKSPAAAKAATVDAASLKSTAAVQMAAATKGKAQLPRKRRASEAQLQEPPPEEEAA